MHTQDKWTVEDISKGYIKEFRIICKDSDERNVEIVAEAANEENANLIAAAPIMYKELKSLKKKLQSLANTAIQVSFTVRAIESINSAIAKAEENNG